MKQKEKLMKLNLLNQESIISMQIFLLISVLVVVFGLIAIVIMEAKDKTKRKSNYNSGHHFSGE